MCLIVIPRVWVNQFLRKKHSLLNSRFKYEARDALNQTVLQIITSAVHSISMKSIFARTVKGSQGVVANSINIAVVCSVGTLVNIWNNKRNPLTGKHLIEMVCDVLLWHTLFFSIRILVFLVPCEYNRSKCLYPNPAETFNQCVCR